MSSIEDLVSSKLKSFTPVILIIISHIEFKILTNALDGTIAKASEPDIASRISVGGIVGIRGVKRHIGLFFLFFGILVKI